MTQSVYEKFMRAIVCDDCATVMQHWSSPKLTESDRQWGFKEAVQLNNHTVVQHMLSHCLDVDRLLANDYGNCLKWVAGKNTPSQLMEFNALTNLLVSYANCLSGQQQYETFALFVEFQHHTGAAQMAEVVGAKKTYMWLQDNPHWKKKLPDLMQNITLQNSVGNVPGLTQPSIRKM